MSVIEKGRPGASKRPRRGGRRWLLLLLLVAALAGLWWLRRGSEPEPVREPTPRAEPLPPLAPEVPAPTAEVAPEPQPPPDAHPAPELARAEPLPPLAGSDPLVRELKASVSKHTLLGVLLREAGGIDRFVLLVDNLAEGLVPRRTLSALLPKERLLVLGAEPELRIDPASYRRFDAVTAAIASLDASAAVAAYRRVAPLCEQSYRALGYPEGGFETRLRAALALLLSTPVPEAAPLLIPETLRYEFADPALEHLSDAQKLLLRMGPENGERVRAKLREIQTALR
ncbi:MAG: DUF3014 domain-containing protein [Myxococcota bacterium]